MGGLKNMISAAHQRKKITEETPKYEKIFTDMDIAKNIEFRKYEPNVVVKTQMDDPQSKNYNNKMKNRKSMNSAFMKLAGYIGVMSEPQNAEKERIPMTAPVIHNSDGEMEFVLPASFGYSSDNP